MNLFIRIVQSAALAHDPDRERDYYRYYRHYAPRHRQKRTRHMNNWCAGKNRSEIFDFVRHGEGGEERGFRERETEAET